LARWAVGSRKRASGKKGGLKREHKWEYGMGGGDRKRLDIGVKNSILWGGADHRRALIVASEGKGSRAREEKPSEFEGPGGCHWKAEKKNCLILKREETKMG